MPASAPMTGEVHAADRQAVADALLLRQIDGQIHAGHYGQAESAARTRLASLEGEGLADSEIAALYADRLIDVLLEGGKGTRTETLALARRAVQIRERLSGPASIELAGSLERLGRVLTQRTAFDEAQQALDSSRGMFATLNAPSGGAAVEVTESLGELAMARSDFTVAQQSLEEVLVAREGAVGTDPVAVARTLRLLGDCARRQYDHERARALLGRSQQILQANLAGAHPELARTLTSLGRAEMLAGQNDKAKADLERAIAVFDESLGQGSPPASDPMIALALLSVDLGDFATARVMIEQSHAIRLEEYGARHPLVAMTVYTSGLLHDARGDIEAAAEAFEQTRRDLQAVYGTRNLELASALNSLAIAFAKLDRPREAEPLFLQALDIQTSILGPDNQLVARTLNNLSLVSSLLGNDAQQLQYGLAALAIMERGGDTNGHVLGGILTSLSLAARRQGNTAQALDLAQKALEAMERTFGPSHPEVGRALLNRAGRRIEAGQWEAGLNDAVRAEQMSREHVALTARAALESEALVHAATRFTGIPVLIALAELHPSGDGAIQAAAWDAVIRSRALVLDELISRRRLMPASDPEMRRLAEEVRRSSASLAKLTVNGQGGEDPGDLARQVDAAMRAKASAERALAARSREFRDSLQIHQAGLGDVTQAMQPGDALVAFVRYGRREVLLPERGKPEEPDAAIPAYAAFVLASPAARPVLVPIGDAARIDELVMRWRRATAAAALSAGRSTDRSEALYVEIASELRRAVWDPVSAHIGEAGTVLVVPDGDLNVVSFAALPAGGGQYVVEQGLRLHYLAAERDLVAPPPARLARGLVVVSSPDFDSRSLFAALGPRDATVATITRHPGGDAYRGARSACGTFQSMRFGALPAAGREARAIVEMWQQQPAAVAHGDPGGAAPGEVLALAGPAASEQAVKNSASGHRVLHFATHGFALGGRCPSYLDGLQAVGDAQSAAPAVTRENPLLLSGLALAGANHRGSAGQDEDDGILTAEEISTLDLQGTEWAVLSACNTGIGEIRPGEGVLGLRRAFQLAGAGTVIMSLWPVQDEATRGWMSALYRHRFVGSESTIEAVNGASLEILRGRRARGESTHPFYWAGFIAAGDRH